jgi:hypothetical protein
MKTGLEILNDVINSLPGASPEKIVYYASFKYPCPTDFSSTTFVMYYKGVKCGQKTYGILKGIKEVPVWEGSSVTRTLRWEEENGIALEEIEGFLDYRRKKRLYETEKLAEHLPEIIRKFDIQVKPEDTMIATISGYEDRGHYREGMYDWGKYIVPKKPLIERVRRWDEEFTKTLKPETTYFVDGGLLHLTFPIVGGRRITDGTTVIENTHSYTLKHVNLPTLDKVGDSVEKTRKLLELTNELMNAVEKYSGELEALFEHYVDLNETIEKVAEKKRIMHL